MATPRSLPRGALLLLALEKFVQHMVVTYGLVTDVSGVRSRVAADPRWLAGAGFVVGVLFLACAVGMLRARRWSAYGLLALALFDVAGEYVAQGTLAVQITLSFVVAWLIVLVVVAGRRALFGPPPGAGV